VLSGAVLLAGALGGCSSSVSDIRPSPIPPGYLEALAREGGGDRGTTRREREEGEQVVDGLVAAVGDRFLTRSEVLRRQRLDEGRRRQPGMSAEDEIDVERVRWAQTQLLGIAARQAGLRPDVRMVDDIVRQQMKKYLDEAAKQEGRPVGEAEWLAAKRLTKEEFRRQFEDEVIAMAYIQKLMHGLGGPTRPEVDAEVTPQEVRRIFRDHPQLFENPAKVRGAVFVFAVSGLADERHTPAQWQELAERRADQLAELFEQGHDAEFLARRYGLDDDKKGDWVAAVVPMPIESVIRNLESQIPGIEAWLQRPDLAARQTLVTRSPRGPIVFGVIETEAASQRSYAEAHDIIVDAIRQARTEYLRARTVLQMLDAGSVVSPPELEDRVLDAAQGQLDKLASDDILGSVRLR
jgi:hypothetical protein